MPGLKSILNPSQSVGVGIGIGAVDLLIFSQMVPPSADIRRAAPQNTDVESERRKAVMYCVGVNGFISLITRDWNVFLIGGIVTIAMSYVISHANEVNPATGKMTSSETSVDQSIGDFSLPDYQMSQSDMSYQGG